MCSQPLGATLRIEKPGDIGQFVRHPVSWQRLQENFTIGHALEAGIQQREHSTVRLFAEFRCRKPVLALKQGFGRLIRTRRTVECSRCWIPAPGACPMVKFSWSRCHDTG